MLRLSRSRFIPIGLIFGISLCPWMSLAVAVEPPAEPDPIRKTERELKFLEGMDQIKVYSGPRSDAVRKAAIERNIRERLAEVRKEAEILRQREAELLKQAEQAGLSIEAGEAEEPKQEKHLLEFKAETQKIKHLQAAAEHLKAAEMHELAESLIRQADTLAQFVKEAREISTAAREAQRKKILEQLRESIHRQQEGK